MPASTKLDDKDLRRVAVAGDLDPRTVRKALDGRAVSSSSLRKVKRGLRHCGLVGLLPESQIAVARAESKIAAAERRTVRHLERLAAIAAAAGSASPFAAELVRLAEQRRVATEEPASKEGAV